MQVRLTRLSSNPNEGTFGALVMGGSPVCLTLEPYWRENKRNISSIPSGQYICKRVESPTYGTTFEVTNIEGRDDVLFHWGNRDNNTRGCILLGEEFGFLYGDQAVLSSKRAFLEFMSLMDLFKIDEFTLTIVECY